MLKKDTLVILGCVVLFVILAALLIFEMQNPEGGVAMIANLFGNASGK